MLTDTQIKALKILNRIFLYSQDDRDRIGASDEAGRAEIQKRKPEFNAMVRALNVELFIVNSAVNEN